MDCELLISLVHERRSLWDQKNKNYHNRNLNKKLCREVGAAMKLEGRYFHLYLVGITPK